MYSLYNIYHLFIFCITTISLNIFQYFNLSSFINISPITSYRGTMPCIGNVEPLILVQNGLYLSLFTSSNTTVGFNLCNTCLPCLPIYFTSLKSQRYYSLYVLICQLYLVMHIFIFNNRGQILCTCF